jgi:hypothetical protein
MWKRQYRDFLRLRELFSEFLNPLHFFSKIACPCPDEEERIAFVQSPDRDLL